MEIKMKRTKKLKKWKILIVFIWIAVLAAACIGCMSLQRANTYEKAKTELVDQAEIISGQFTSLVDTNFYTRAALIDRQLSEIKAISFVLENYEDIDRAGDFLEDVVNTTEVKNLWVYDRDGKIVFGSGTPKNKLEPEDVSTLLDTKAYEAIEGAYSGDDRYWITTYYLENDNNGTLWGVKDQWLVQVENNFSEIQKNGSSHCRNCKGKYYRQGIFQLISAAYPRYDKTCRNAVEEKHFNNKYRRYVSA